MGKSVINNGTHRWFAQRYFVLFAWFFYGFNGTLSYSYVFSTYRSRALALLEFKS